MKQNYILIDERCVIQSVHRWFLSALHARFTKGGRIYWRRFGSPMWWEPMSCTGQDLWFGTLTVAPGFEAKSRRNHCPDVAL